MSQVPTSNYIKLHLDLDGFRIYKKMYWEDLWMQFRLFSAWTAGALDFWHWSAFFGWALTWCQCCDVTCEKHQKHHVFFNMSPLHFNIPKPGVECKVTEVTEVTFSSFTSFSSLTSFSSSPSVPWKLTRLLGFLKWMAPSLAPATQEGPMGAPSGLNFLERLPCSSKGSLLRRPRKSPRGPLLAPETSDQLRRKPQDQLWWSCSGTKFSLKSLNSCTWHFYWTIFWKPVYFWKKTW